MLAVDTDYCHHLVFFKIFAAHQRAGNSRINYRDGDDDNDNSGDEGDDDSHDNAWSYTASDHRRKFLKCSSINIDFILAISK